MSADQSHADGGGCPGGAGVDNISGLPDHLLHDVLIRLPGTADAARTSILSRRWRRVWVHLPELSLDYTFQPAVVSRAVAGIDAALAAHDAGTTVSRLEIAMPPTISLHLPMGRVSAWLLLASQRLAGKLRIALPYHHHSTTKQEEGEEEEVILPLYERATSIGFDLKMRIIRFRLPPAGVFKALATLRIRLARMDGSELEAALSSRCPALKELVLESIALLLQDGATRDLSIRSDSLERLEVSFHRFDGGRLHVDAPKLRKFHPCITRDLCVLAPKLSELRWRSYDYDSTRHHLAKPGHQLRRLEVEADLPGSALMRQFNNVDELDLTVYLPQGVQKYEQFLECTDKLAKCKVLLVRFVAKIEHGFKPAMLHLLRKCAGIRRLVVQLSDMNDYPCKLSSGCPCSRLESCKTQDLVLDSLEEVVINDHGEADHKVELVRLLCRCSATFHKRVSITVSESGRTHYMRKKILEICPPNNKVEIAVRAT